MDKRKMHARFWWGNQKKMEEPLANLRCRWENNIKIDVREIG
jgi:hypothetical protein